MTVLRGLLITLIVLAVMVRLKADTTYELVNWRVGELVNANLFFTHQLTNSPTHQFSRVGSGFSRTFQSAPSDNKADALSEAARKGDAAAVKKLLDDGVDVNTKFRYNRTALSFAADRGHVDVVKVLLDHGADVNVKDTFYGATALMWAVSPAMERKPQHTEVVRQLLAKGGIPEADLTSALQAATRAKLPDVVALLERAGAKPRDK